MSTPEHLGYTKEHEWALREGAEVLVGITRFAADALGDVVFVDLPAVGARVTEGETFGVVESVKSVSDLFSPVDGEVIAVNQDLRDAPEQVNEDPYGAGWMIRVRVTAEPSGLLSSADYQALVAQL